MPDAPPAGILPLFLRGATCEKYKMKTGDGVNDLVDYILIAKEELLKEIQTMGVMSDFEVSKKSVEAYTGEQILIVIDKSQQYGETFLLCYTEAAKEDYLSGLKDKEAALEAQRQAEADAETARKAAEEARLNVVYEDKPMSSRPWETATAVDTEEEVKELAIAPARELISIEISRPKRFTKQSYKFSDRNADLAEFRSYKDPGFKLIREADVGIQVAPICSDATAQTTWFRLLNKAVQYESAAVGTEPTDDENKNALLSFLEKATVTVENALQQNESVDIFNETFRLLGDDDATEGVQTDNEMRELKNFADPNYSKFKVLAAIDWMPKAQGMVAVSAVRNVSFDQRISISGQTYTSYILVWDFRLLVKPLILMQSQHEIFTFRFNKINNGLVAGGCLTGQVVLWDINDAMASAARKNTRGGHQSDAQDEDEQPAAPVLPKYISHVDFSHKKCVTDLFWLPPTTQINYRGQLVGDEHLDGNSYQFVTVAGDGLVMVWDIRYEQISNDELRHIGRAKHVPTEKSSNKDGGQYKILWAPIFRAHLKRLEGLGELSLCKICETVNAKKSSTGISNPANFSGDHRSQFMIATEEGDIIFTDLSSVKTKGEGKADDEEEEDGEGAREYVKWIAADHPRPCVALQESPFFPQLYLSVSDWNFNIWKLGEEQPIFTSPMSNTYLTAGAWSPTRSAVVFVATSDGQIMAWDFTDSSIRSSIELKATHSRITSMEFLASTTGISSRYQLLAVGDQDGTLHIFEVPRNLTKAMHKEESIMLKFVERELQRIAFSNELGVNTLDVSGGDSLLSIGRLGTAADNDHGANVGASEETLQAGLEVQTKEDDEFLKLESIFISELGLAPEQLPGFMAVPATVSDRT